MFSPLLHEANRKTLQKPKKCKKSVGNLHFEFFLIVLDDHGKHNMILVSFFRD